MGGLIWEVSLPPFSRPNFLFESAAFSKSVAFPQSAAFPFSNLPPASSPFVWPPEVGPPGSTKQGPGPYAGVDLRRLHTTRRGLHAAWAEVLRSPNNAPFQIKYTPNNVPPWGFRVWQSNEDPPLYEENHNYQKRKRITFFLKYIPSGEFLIK